MLQEDLGSYLVQKATEKRIPVSCHLDLTYNCNLDCIHCYIVKENRREMKTSEIINIIDQLADLGTLYLSLSGGEIFIRDDFFEIAEYARDRHFALNVFTNGTLIDDEIADKLVDLSLYQLFVSIYSTDPKIHDKITEVPGSLQKTINAVKMLRSRDIPINISSIIMKQNVNEYDNIYKMAKKLGVEVRFDPQITPKTNGNMTPVNDNQINEDDLSKILVDPILKSNLSSDPVEHNNIFTDIPCGAAHTTFYISPYGDIFPCVQFPLFCGNFRENSLHDIWYNSQNMLYASSLRISHLPVCSECELRKYCHYCPGLSVLEENNIMIPPNRCCKEAELVYRLKGGEIHEKSIPKTGVKSRENV